MYGQMTAGSWIYIGTQGIVQGTYETFAAVAREAVRRHPGRHAHPHRRLRRDGRRAAARGHHERRRLPLSSTSTATRLDRRVEHRYLDAVADDLDHAVAAAPWRPSASRRAVASASLGNAADVFPELLRRGVADRHRHRPDLGARPAVLPARGRRRSTTGTTTRERKPGGVHRPGPRVDGRARRGDGRRSMDAGRRGLRLRQLDPRRGPEGRATTGPSTSPASSRPTSGRCSARARARSAGRRSPVTRRTSPPPTARSWTCSPTTTASRSGSAAPARRSRFQGLPARICWLGYGERDKAGLAFNDLVASGERQRPDRHRPRPPRLRLGRQPLPRDRVDARRLRRDRRLAAAQRPGQHRVRRLLGVDPPRRRRRHRPLDPRRPGLASPTAPTLAGAEARAGAHQRPRHGRHPARRRGLRPRRRRWRRSAASASRCARTPSGERGR